MLGGSVYFDVQEGSCASLGEEGIGRFQGPALPAALRAGDLGLQAEKYRSFGGPRPETDGQATESEKGDIGEDGVTALCRRLSNPLPLGQSMRRAAFSPIETAQSLDDRQRSF